MPFKGQVAKIKEGDVFHYLTVVSFHHQDKRWRRHYLCACKCGREKVVQGTLLTTGNTKSCGCYSKESARKRSLPHGTASIRQVIAGYKHKAKKADIEWALTVPQFVSIATAPCFYCGRTGTNVRKSPHGTGDFAYNGLDKIDPAKGYTLNNVVPSCKICNFSKSNRSQGDFIRWIRDTYTHLKQNAMAAQWG